MILEIYNFDSKKNKDFQTKKNINWVCKIIDRNDIDISYKSSLKSWTAKGQCNGSWEEKQTFRSAEGKETHNQMMIQWNPLKLWLTSVNEKCLLMMGRWMNITISTEGNVA